MHGREIRSIVGRLQSRTQGQAGAIERQISARN